MYLNEIAVELKGQLAVIYNNTVLIKSEYFENMFRLKYGTWETLDKTSEDFKHTFYLYNEYMTPNLNKAISALTAEYNPLNNYEGKTEIIQEYGEQTQNFIKGQESITNTNNAVTDNTEDYITSYDSDIFSPASKNKNDYGERISTTENGTRTDTNTINSYTNKVTEIKAGNMGVTTSQQMITEEINLRLKNIYDMYIDNFVKNVCYMIV